MKMIELASTSFYGRFSTGNQKDTSIDDQLRRCRQKAATEGLEISDDLIFTDYAVSGAETEAREGYQRLLKAWDEGKFKVLVIDTQSRICRNKLESAILEEKIKSTGVRVITCNGVDTQKNPGWDVLWSMTGVFDAKLRDDVAFNVKRGLEGAVMRGYIVTGRAPYGYTRVPEYTSSGDRVGTRWAINEEEAVIVRRVYHERSAGDSYWNIVRRLNAEGITKRGRHWDKSSIIRMLSKPEYRGEYLFNGVTYPRPDWKIIEAETQEKVKPGKAKISGTGRGGGTCWATGLLRCCHHARSEPKKRTNAGSYDGRYMSVKHNKSGQFLVCPECVEEQQAGLRAYSGYVSTNQLQALLTTVLRSVFTPQALEAFRYNVSKLRESLPVEEVEALNIRIAGIDRAIARVVTTLSLVEDEVAVDECQRRLAELQNDKNEAKARLQFLQEKLATLDTSIYERQLSVDPRMVLPTIFEFNQPQHIRAVMSQLFREITLLPYDDLAKRTYNYRVTFSVANAVAQLTGTPVLLDDWQTIEYQVRSTSAGGKRSAMVYQLMEDGTYSDENLGQTRDCVVCSLELPVEEFGKRKKDGYYTRCESCRTCWNARCRKHNRTWEARRAAKTAELAEAA